MKIKICGMKTPKNIQEIVSLNPDLIGFIFYKKSRRYIDKSTLQSSIQKIPAPIKKVGVFVNETNDVIQAIAQQYALDIIQLHGEESIAQCQALHEKGFNIIKAFPIQDKIDIEVLATYIPYCSAFLFDTKTSQYGGSGQAFNWNILQNYTLDKPFYLSGGIGLSNIKQALKIKHPALIGFDCNSQLEDEAGLKNYNHTKQLINTIRNEHI